ncbi:MAG: helicase-related protein [Micromonosporaceae bacterium]
MSAPVSYADFLATKARRSVRTGPPCSPEDVHPFLHDWQRELTAWAVRTGNAALWWDTGLGKTLAELEFARLAADRSLIIAPLAVCHQTVAEAAKVDLDVRYVRSGEGLGPGVWITNYEMAERFDADDFGAVILDEASILKHHDAKTRGRLIRHFADVPAKLAATATPAPNDPEELTGQAEWLGLMTRPEMLASYYINDPKTGGQKWRLKGHARGPMFSWLATWAAALRSPADLGYDATGYELPPLDVRTHLLPVGEVEVEGQLFPVPASEVSIKGITGRSTVRKATVQQRCEYAAELIAKEPDEPWIVWCDRNDEADTMARLLPGSVNVHGSMSPEEKAEALLGFARGEIQILITKPKIASFGMNWQHCARSVHVGLSDSMESLYQAIRRCWRYGQVRPVEAHIVLTEAEQVIADNVARKQRQMDELIDELVAAMTAARMGARAA